MKKYYKVVRVVKGRLVSSVAEAGAACTYGKGQWTKPRLRRTKLFCYASKKSAKLHISMMGGAFRDKYRLFECKAKNPVPTKKDVSIYATLEGIKYYWGLTKKVPALWGRGSPLRYILADEIKLTKEITKA